MADTEPAASAGPATVRARPCATCPYRRDAPSGLWAADEYRKLPRYDGEIGEQAMAGATAPFMCHHQDGRVCAGWAGHRPAGDLLAVRLGVLCEALAPEVAEYTTSVPLWPSGAAAAAHGLADVAAPSPTAQAAAVRVLRARGLDGVHARRVVYGGVVPTPPTEPPTEPEEPAPMSTPTTTRAEAAGLVACKCGKAVKPSRPGGKRPRAHLTPNGERCPHTPRTASACKRCGGTPGRPRNGCASNNFHPATWSVAGAEVGNAAAAGAVLGVSGEHYQQLVRRVGRGSAPGPLGYDTARRASFYDLEAVRQYAPTRPGIPRPDNPEA